VVDTEIRRIVETKLNALARCRGHCEEQATLKLSEVEGVLVGTYSCSSGYVSRLLNYGAEVDLGWFRDFVSRISKGIGEVKDADVRVATRYPWDLGLKERGGFGRVLREAYWTQNYRRTESSDSGRPALFSCTSCQSFYVQSISGNETLCPNCRDRRRKTSAAAESLTAP